MPKGISLHIGVNIVDGDHYQGWTGPLKGCEADAQAMLNIAQSQGFTARVLETADATRDAVIAGIAQAAATLEGGDIFMLTYSGHGGQVRDISGDEDDDIDETWCLYDGQLIDDELDALWPKFSAGTRILVLSDSCHSGSVTRNIGMAGDISAIMARDTKSGLEPEYLGYRFMPGKVARPVYRANRQMYDDAQDAAASARGDIVATVRLISGCQDDELSREYKGHGLFTRAIMDIWNDGAFEGNYKTLHQEIQTKISEIQNPNHKVDGAPNPSFDSERAFSV